jgi:UDP-hydrolysing UDP-N-acetyl-D-glucosamine 2-epimerase
MFTKRSIDFLSVGRSDFGRYRSIFENLAPMPDIDMNILVGGNHEDDRFGHTIDEVIASGYPHVKGFSFIPPSDSPDGVGLAIAAGTERLVQRFTRRRPDLLVVLGDRYEMFCGAAAALGFELPVIHIHGGAVTEGALDDRVRHALTKISHFHLVSCEQYARRVRQMGEEDWRVVVTGAPGLDGLREASKVSSDELSQFVGLDVTKPTILVSLHPVTLEAGRVSFHVDTLIEALAKTADQIVLTYPNADPGYQVIIDGFKEFQSAHSKRVVLINNLGTRYFNALLGKAVMLIGNSSSGIVEAASFELPVVNIGSRQDGKEKARNVIDVPFDVDRVGQAIAKAASPLFRMSLRGLQNPYGDGRSGKRIADLLHDIEINDRLLRKKFSDL